VQNQISTRAQSISGVNMDEELANLTIYQNAYTASARVVQTVNAMFDTLMSIKQ
jgi:flagellar hook-associated protein 1 FlgK